MLLMLVSFPIYFTVLVLVLFKNTFPNTDTVRKQELLYAKDKNQFILPIQQQALGPFVKKYLITACCNIDKLSDTHWTT